MDIPSGKTVYVAGGAIVKGCLRVRNAQKIKIFGKLLTPAHLDRTELYVEESQATFRKRTGFPLNVSMQITHLKDFQQVTFELICLSKKSFP